MEAGRALDARVAEEVMNAGMTVIVQKDGELLGLDMDTEDWLVVPHYSTDIAAAWQIVGHLREKGLYCHLTSDPDGWACQIYDYETTPPHPRRGWNRDEGLTAPLAICLAALMAVGADG